MIITKSKLNINKGAYPEEIINRTGLYYLEKNIGILEKRQIPICILNKTNDKITGKLLSKSSVDYFCFLNNRYSEFEVKQTSNDYFSITQLLAHQMNYLKKMKNIKINTFLIIYFSKYDTFYIANFEWIIAKTINTTKIKYEEFKNNCQQLKIIFPGILNIINYL